MMLKYEGIVMHIFDMFNISDGECCDGCDKILLANKGFKFFYHTDQKIYCNPCFDGLINIIYDSGHNAWVNSFVYQTTRLPNYAK